jgi:hypothetical protein
LNGGTLDGRHYLKPETVTRSVIGSLAATSRKPNLSK